MTRVIHDILRDFGSLLPDDLILDGQLGSDTVLALPEEMEAAEPMVEKRALEFLTGRTCARRCLRKLGAPDAPLLPGSDRAPQWPDGAIGSISHTQGIVIAAVGRANDYFGLGIDVERRGAVDPKLEKFIATANESELHTHIPDWRTIVFSGKESVFKALNPPTGIWLEFRHVEFTEIGDDSFVARVSPEDRTPFELEGRYRFDESYVLSAVVLPTGFTP